MIDPNPNPTAGTQRGSQIAIVVFHRDRQMDRRADLLRPHRLATHLGCAHAKRVSAWVLGPEERSPQTSLSRCYVRNTHRMCGTSILLRLRPPIVPAVIGWLSAESPAQCPLSVRPRFSACCLTPSCLPSACPVSAMSLHSELKVSPWMGCQEYKFIESQQAMSPSRGGGS